MRFPWEYLIMTLLYVAYLIGYEERWHLMVLNAMNWVRWGWNLSEQEHAMYKVHMQADECAHARCIWDVLCSTRLEMECAIEHTRPSRRCWWKWSRGVNGRWCQQLCSAVLCCVLLCAALLLCCVLLCSAAALHCSALVPAAGCASQGWAYKPPPLALPDHYYWLLVVYQYKASMRCNAHTYMYIGTHTSTSTLVYYKPRVSLGIQFFHPFHPISTGYLCINIHIAYTNTDTDTHIYIFTYTHLHINIQIYKAKNRQILHLLYLIRIGNSLVIHIWRERNPHKCNVHWKKYTLHQQAFHH